MSKLILFNAPKLAGKNVAIEYLRSQGLELVDRRCKDKLFELVCSLFNISKERFFDLYENRDTKEVPQRELLVEPTQCAKLFEYLYDMDDIDDISGRVINAALNWAGKRSHEVIDSSGSLKIDLKAKLSPREALIFVSEFMCKPVFGSDYFGKSRADAIEEGEIACEDSCAFPDELVPSIDKLGQENILLIRILGRGSFEGDSRDYIPDGVINNTVDIYNDGCEQDFLEKVYEVVEEFCYG